MNAKQLLAAALIAVSGTAAYAGEVTQFVDAPSTLPRAQVKAELAQALKDGTAAQPGEAATLYSPIAPQLPQPAVAESRSRQDVRAEARAVVRDRSKTTNSYSPAVAGSIGG